jgi:hypothetical protein
VFARWSGAKTAGGLSVAAATGSSRYLRARSRNHRPTERKGNTWPLFCGRACHGRYAYGK